MALLGGIMVTLVVLGKYNDIFSEFLNNTNVMISKDVPRIFVRDGHEIPDPPGWQVIQGPRQFSMAGNGNLGLKAVDKNSDILYVGDDVRFTSPNPQENLIRDAYSDPAIGILSASINGGASNPLQYERISQLTYTDRPVAFICVFLKREMIEKIGYFDEQFSAYGYDDFDIFLRARDAGFKTAVTPNVLVNHGHGSATFERNTYQNYTSNRHKFEQKWGKAYL
jgi:GT2 family glycosyltransferase